MTTGPTDPRAHTPPARKWTSPSWMDRSPSSCWVWGARVGPDSSPRRGRPSQRGRASRRRAAVSRGRPPLPAPAHQLDAALGAPTARLRRRAWAGSHSSSVAALRVPGSCFAAADVDAVAVSRSRLPAPPAGSADDPAKSRLPSWTPFGSHAVSAAPRSVRIAADQSHCRHRPGKPPPGTATQWAAGPPGSRPAHRSRAG